jgi:hypothetical protein
MEVIPMQPLGAEGSVGVFGPSHQSKQAKTNDNPDGKWGGGLPAQQDKDLVSKGL